MAIFSTTNGIDNITGTPDDDVVYSWLRHLQSGDHIVLDGGNDTLFIRDIGGHFNSGNYSNFSGIDVLDVTSSGGHADLVITQKFAEQSEGHALTIKYSGGIQHLDTSDVNHGSSIVLLAGDGDVRLSRNDDTVQMDIGSSGRIYGLGGNDALYGNNQADFLFGGAGNDVLRGGAGDDTLSGGKGADTFDFDGLPGHDTVVDFESNEAINIGRLLAFNGLVGKSAEAAINDGNIMLTQDGKNTVVSFDADGSAGSVVAPVAFVTLENTQVANVHLVSDF